MLQPIYAVDESADLYGFVPPDGTIFIANGQTSRDDRFPLIYEFLGVSTATDDGDNTIRPTAIGSGSPGRFLKRKLDYSQMANLPSAPSFTTPTRTLNSAAFQPSSTRNTLVNYTIQIAATISLTTGQTGTVALQISPTSGGTYVTIASLTNGNTGTLTIGLNLTQTQSAVLSGMIPFGYFVKLVSTGTATNTIVAQQEVLF